jgi:predicted Fe-Mo cluster-binding NifX family protein
MDPRFGRTEYILVYDDKTDKFDSHDNKEIWNVVHGAGPQTAQKLFDLHPDILITGNGPGGNAARVLEKSGVKIFIGAGDMTVEQAFKAFEQNTLTKME